MRRGVLGLTALGLPFLVATETSSAPNLQPRAQWPNGPFSTTGRWMVDASGANVTYAGANWPGHVDTMVPEGLQYESIASIVSQIKSLGMNVIRLTYAIEMIDDIYENGGSDVPIQTAFTSVLGQENGTDIFNKVLANNPSFSNSTTRLQVFDAIAAECARQEIYVHLDNQISKAGWCCTSQDGNTWWGDIFFSAANWTRGLAYMANHGRAWPNLMSMSLRNELREPLTNLNVTLYEDSYNWQDWYMYMREGADAIHSNNSDVLIFLSGLDGDTSLSVVVDGSALSPGTATFSTDDFSGYANKLVLELHSYDNSATNCTALEDGLYDQGFNTLTSNATNHFPMVMTEFGFTQDATTWQGVYATCLASYLPAQDAGWMIWVLGGSYYIRQGVQDADEGYGLLTHNWSTWRSPGYINGRLKPLVQNTLAFLNASTGNQSANASAAGASGNESNASGASGRHDGILASLLPSCLLAFFLAGLFSIGMSL